MSSPLSPPPYKQIDELAYTMPGLKPLSEGEECEIVEIKEDLSNVKRHNYNIFSNGPFITVTLKSRADAGYGSHGKTPGSIVIKKDGTEITQGILRNKYTSFYFVVKGGIPSPFSGGRKSRSRNSNKNKRTRRKSVKRLHRRK